MRAILVLVQLLVCCSGIPLVFVMAGHAVSRREPGCARAFVAYLGVSLLVLVDAVATAAYRLEDFFVALAANESLASAFLDILGVLVVIGQGSWLVAASGFGRGSRTRKSRAPEFATSAALAWIIAILVVFAFGSPRFGSFDAAAALQALFRVLSAWFLVRAIRVPEGGGLSSGLSAIAKAALGVFMPLESACWLAERVVPAFGPEPARALRLVGFLVLTVGLYRRHYSLPRALPAKDGAEFLEACGLSLRERDVASRLAAGERYKTIAETLCISVDTVKSHAKAVYRKTGARDRLELIGRARRGD